MTHSNSDTSPRHWPAATLFAGLASGTLLWAALPPLGWSWLAWFAPLGWLWLVGQDRLPGKRPYLALWFAGFLHWLLVMQGIRQAHPALYLALIALAAYVAVYQPLFVGLTRVAVRRCSVSLIIAAPVVWIGLELLRGHVITGFSMALLGHTQANWPELIQIADAFGAYAVSGVVMFVAACLISLRSAPGCWRPWPLIPLVAVLGSVWLYGVYRLRQPTPNDRVLRVALIQSSVDTIFEYNPDRIRASFQQCLEGTMRVRRDEPQLDLIVWPESMFTRGVPQIVSDGPLSSIANADLRERLEDMQDNFAERVRIVSGNFGSSAEPPRAHVIVGTETEHLHDATADHYNTALLIGPDGTVRDHYYKQHAVMFGEYIPFGEAIPLIYRLSPMPYGLSAGPGPASFEVGAWRLSPSVCFESTVPHLIRNQVAQMVREGRAPDALVNLTNDGWFWGTSILDLQFRCATFRAVENRRPMLIAANTGLTGWIDGRGVVRTVAPRRQVDQIVAEVMPDGRAGWYQRFGDEPMWLCVAACAILAIFGWRSRTRASEEGSHESKARSP